MRAGRVLAALSVIAVLAGCGSTIEGTPVAAGVSGADGEFRSLLEECDTVTPEQIADVVGGDAIDQGFIGAICRWDLTGPGGAVKVTFDWFETGSLAAEREANERMGWTVSDVEVSSRKALEIRQPDDPASCGVAAQSPDSGVIGWWVQYRPGNPTDPCESATRLMQLSLNLSA
ncbi:DUF3558 domain-containing protein [Rhodococcus sp. SORGH_AS_0301]|uniref:DUF3558 domain-containing protein n=1 Tax=Rhodococcus sp. SORGH_AS_0301 TaxID=3041780 RepID=UPI0027874F33|nr:DUF3558 domain-containing protein [Rhodococcus sp. SORGH_AS_0301]MDQ1178956.1 hypothetical protein [Rhodococcus sp. SORGH_AS_0301]